MRRSVSTSRARRVWPLTPIALVTMVAVASAASRDESVRDAEWTGTPQPATSLWLRPLSTLWDNGPLVNCPGCGAGGADESRLQDESLGMTSLGFSHQHGLDFALADEFTVPSGENWSISGITFFAYQTGSSTTSTITGLYVAIYDGPPDSGGGRVWGNFTTNIMTSTGWTGIYRSAESVSGTVTNRPIMASVADPDLNGGLTLGPGTYWLAWSAAGNDQLSGPWGSPITINGQSTTGNGLQSTDGAYSVWAPIDDGGTLTPQGLPFVIEGTASTAGAYTCLSPDCLVVTPSGVAHYRGRLLRDGSPAAGTALRLIFGDGCTELLACPEPGQTPPVLTTTTDSNGDFEFAPAMSGCCLLVNAARIEVVTGGVLVRLIDTIGTPDGVVDLAITLADFVEFQAAFNANGRCYDIDEGCDEIVNLLDMVAFQRHFNTSCR